MDSKQCTASSKRDNYYARVKTTLVLFVHLGSVALRVPGLYVRPVVEQQADHALVAAPRGEVQRGGVAAAPRAHVGPAEDERARHVVVPVEGGVV